MNRRELVTAFKDAASRTGKVLEIEPVRNGTRVTCEGRFVHVPTRSGQYRHIAFYMSRLGLRRQP